MVAIDEVAPDLFRLSVYVPDIDLAFNHFLIRDEEPLLYHTGMRSMFPLLREAVARVIDPADIRWIGFSHFEVDECGALNEWLATAPQATPVCGFTGAMVNLSDFSDRPARGLATDEILETGQYRFRFKATPHLPHGWDAGVLFEETQRTLLCSDLLHQNGDVEAVTEASVSDRCRATMQAMQAGPLMDYMPYTPYADRLIESLAELAPQTLATMHGSIFIGDGARELREWAGVFRETMSHP